MISISARRLTVLFLLALAVGIGSAESPLSTPAAAAVGNPIVGENQLPGTDRWELGHSGFQRADDTSQQIKGYASATSVNAGSAITFHVTVNPAQTFSIDVYRLGWYGGMGGRLMQHVAPLDGVQQPACPVDSTTGVIECGWSASYTLNVPSTWTTGIYMVMLTNSQNYQNQINFVVRDDSRVADLLYQESVTTYQAYNNYPNDGVTGKSLYDGGSGGSYGANTVTGTKRAAAVSFDRPYKDGGGGEFLEWEVYFVQWLEQSGYDVSYSTDVDTHENGARLLNYKGFLSVGHDEYWSKEMYDAAEAARAASTNLAFFGANEVYWQIRFAPSSSGVPSRIIVCYKDRALDPVQGPTTTTTWRDPFLNRPEQSLVGIQYTTWFDDGLVPEYPYHVLNSSSWVYDGTGFSDGDTVPGIVGYEVDRLMTEYPPPDSVSYTLLSQSPIVDYSGASDYGNSSIYQAPSGARVFAAGSIVWSWGLSKPGVADPRIQRTAANVLDNFIGPSGPGPYPHPQSAATLDISLVPAFRQCGTGGTPANSVHAPPSLSGGPDPDQSCNPPQPASSVARVGARSVGVAQLTVMPGDVALNVSTTDIQTPTGDPYDPTPGSADADLTAAVRVRVTDTANCSPSPCSDPYSAAGTTADVDFSLPLDCEPAHPGRGSACQANTTANAVIGAGAFSAGRETLLQAFRVRLVDSANALFEQEGFFVP